MSDKQKIDTKNWKVILLSFIVAATFWFFKALNKNNYDARIDYPISFIYDSDSLIVTKPLPEYLKIDVSGGGWPLLRKTFTLSADPVKIRLNNPTEIKSITRVSLLPEVVGQLKSINIRQIITDTLHINIERLKTKKIKVLLDTTSYNIESNYIQVGEPLISPDSITITGPTSILNKINAQYISLDQKGFDSNIEKNVDIVTIDENLVTTNTDEVNVNISVDKLVQQKLLLPIRLLRTHQILDGQTNFYLVDSTVNVSFKAPKSMLDSISESDFSLYVSIGETNRQDSVLVVQTERSSPLAHNIEISPSSVRIIREE